MKRAPEKQMPRPTFELYDPVSSRSCRSCRYLQIFFSIRAKILRISSNHLMSSHNSSKPSITPKVYMIEDYTAPLTSVTTVFDRETPHDGQSE